MTDSIERALDLYRSPEASAPKRPFRFLDAYERGDRDIFFGRDKEIEELRARFYKSRVGVVFGESGVGKTSVLQCGLANAISAEEAEFLVVRSNIAPRAAICEALGAKDKEAEAAPLADLLAARASETSRTVVLVFDQFEEFFLFRDLPERESILRELSAALTRRLDIRLIFCLREEFLARMTEVERVIPDILANKFWLRRMDAADAVQVIEGPCRRAGVKVDPGLAAAVLARLRDSHGEIDLPYLQLVLDRLYVRAEGRGQPVNLKTEDLEALGSLDEILFGFLEDQVDESRAPDLARELLKLFVTTSRTRKAVDVDTAVRELSGRFPKETRESLRELMLSFVDARILRQDAASEQRFELRHDKLAEAIGRWLTPLDEKRAQMRTLVDSRYAEHQTTGALLVDIALLSRIEPYVPELGLPEPVREFLRQSRLATTRARRRRFIVLGVVVSLVIVALVISTLRALNSKEEANAQAVTARSAEELARQAKEVAEREKAAAIEAKKAAEASEEVAKKAKQEADEYHEELEEFARRVVSHGKAGSPLQVDADGDGAPSPLSGDSSAQDKLRAALARVEKAENERRVDLVRQYFAAIKTCDADKAGKLVAGRLGFTRDHYWERKEFQDDIHAHCKPGEQLAFDVADAPDKNGDFRAWVVFQFKSQKTGKARWGCSCRHITVARTADEWAITAIYDGKLGLDEGDLTCTRKPECFGAGAADPLIAATAAYEGHTMHWNNCNAREYGRGLAPALECATATARDEQIQAMQQCAAADTPVPAPPSPLRFENRYIKVDAPATAAGHVAFLACPLPGDTASKPKLVVMTKPRPQLPYLFAGEADQDGAACFDKLGYKPDWSACNPPAPAK